MTEDLFVCSFLEWGLVKHLVGFHIAERSPLIVTALHKYRRVASFSA